MTHSQEINEVSLGLDHQAWKIDITWGDRRSHDAFFVTSEGELLAEVPAIQSEPDQAQIESQLTELCNRDLQEGTLDTPTFIENLYDVADISARLAQFDEMQATTSFVEYVLPRLEAILKELGVVGLGTAELEVIPDSNAIFLLWHVNHCTSLFEQWAYQSTHRTSFLNFRAHNQWTIPIYNLIGQIATRMYPLVPEEEASNRHYLFSLIDITHSITGNPEAAEFLRNLIIEEVRPGQKPEDYVPVTKFIDRKENLFHPDLFDPFIEFWQKVVVRGLGRAPKRQLETRRFLAERFLSFLARIVERLPAEERSEKIQQVQNLVENLSEKNRRKLGL